MALQSCPAGAFCFGKDNFVSKVAGSSWEAVEEQGTLGSVTRLRLTMCPAGYILVRTADKSNMDECVPCIPQTYSLEEATYSYQAGVGYLNSDNAAKVVSGARLCLPCPPGATCNGAEQVDPYGNFWRASSMMCPEKACDPRNGLCEAARCYNGSTAGRRSSSSSGNSKCTDDARCRVRSLVFRCPQGFCPLSNTSIQSTCKEGHHGPLCALCEEGWAMSVRGCEQCIDLGVWPQVLLTAVVVFVLWMLYLFSWRPFMRKKCDTCNYMGTCTSCIGSMLRSQRLSFVARALSAIVAGLTHASTAGYFKIIFSFWQLTGTYNFVYNVEWPKELTELWSFLSAFLQINILDIPTVCSLSFGPFYFVILSLVTLKTMGAISDDPVLFHTLLLTFGMTLVLIF
jgi:hypothetical protein